MDVAGPQLCRQTIALAVEQQQRVVTSRLEVAVVGALLLLAVHRNLGRVHVPHDPLRGIESFRPADEFAVDAVQAAEVLLVGQHLGLERLQPGGQRCPTIPNPLGTDQPERWILREPLGVVDVFIAGDTAIDGLAQ